MILFDSFGHLVSDTSEQELHSFAKRIGLKREWFQTPGFGRHHAHYDLTTCRMIEKARLYGASEVGCEELVKRAWWQGEEGFKCLSVQQPWAWAIFHGKDVENRPKRTSYRGSLLIQASQKLDIEGYQFLWANRDFFGVLDLPADSLLPYGAIVGQATLIDCIENHPSKWFSGPYGYVLGEQKEFKRPFPWKGQLGIFNVPGNFMMRENV